MNLVIQHKYIKFNSGVGTILQPKYIKTLSHLNIVFKLNIICESTRIDISQRILDWLEDSNNSVEDSYIIGQLSYAEKVCENIGVDLEEILG